MTVGYKKIQTLLTCEVWSRSEGINYREFSQHSAIGKTCQ